MVTLEVKPETLAAARTQFGIDANVADAAVFEQLVTKNAENIVLARSLLAETEATETATPDALVFSRLVDSVAVAGEQACKSTARAKKAETDLQLSRTQLATVEKERDQLNLSRTQAPVAPAPPSASELYWASTAVLAARSDAVNAGAITPNVADLAFSRFVQKDVKLDAINLARAVEADDHKLMSGMTQLLEFYEVLKGNVPVPPLGSQTKEQAVLMGRHAAGAEGDKPAPVNPYATTIAALTK